MTLYGFYPAAKGTSGPMRSFVEALANPSRHLISQRGVEWASGGWEASVPRLLILLNDMLLVAALPASGATATGGPLELLTQARPPNSF
jgi:hypothetical protein